MVELPKWIRSFVILMTAGALAFVGGWSSHSILAGVWTYLVAVYVFDMIIEESDERDEK